MPQRLSSHGPTSSRKNTSTKREGRSSWLTEYRNTSVNLGKFPSGPKLRLACMPPEYIDSISITINNVPEKKPGRFDPNQCHTDKIREIIIHLQIFESHISDHVSNKCADIVANQPQYKILRSLTPRGTRQNIDCYFF